MATLARCTRILEDFTDSDGTLKSWRCGQPLQLYVTRSPLREYDELIVLRCPEHIEDVRGVVECEAAPPIDDNCADNWGAF
jgi:hypothetical protein